MVNRYSHFTTHFSAGHLISRPPTCRNVGSMYETVAVHSYALSTTYFMAGFNGLWYFFRSILCINFLLSFSAPHRAAVFFFFTFRHTWRHEKVQKTGGD